MDVAILIGYIVNLVTLILITWRLPHAIQRATERGLNMRPIPQPEAPGEAVNRPQPEG